MQPRKDNSSLDTTPSSSPRRKVGTETASFWEGEGAGEGVRKEAEGNTAIPYTVRRVQASTAGIEEPDTRETPTNNPHTSTSPNYDKIIRTTSTHTHARIMDEQKIRHALPSHAPSPARSVSVLNHKAPRERRRSALDRLIGARSID